VDLPLQIHDARKEFRVSLVIFLLAFGIGVLSSVYDKDFARSVLGNDYVKMTIENIRNHDPLAVYKKGNEAEMFMGITINNLTVSLITFVFGAFMSVGTIFALIRNGIMVGVFQYFFIERGLFTESFLTIWQHGTIEISCIIIAGAAGLTLGKGLIFPGTYSRMQAFKISARRGLKIFTGITPLIIIAAFIEGFITRHTEVNPIVRLMVICVSLGFILFYFAWYPWHLSRMGTKQETFTEEIHYKTPWKYDFSKILSANETLGYTFKFFNQNILFFILLVAGLSVSHSVATLFYEIKNYAPMVSVKHSFSSFFEMDGIGVQFWFGILTLSCLQGLLILKMNKLLENHTKETKTKFTEIFYLCLSSLFVSLILLAPFHLGFLWGLLSIVFFGPILFLAVYQGFLEKVFFLAVIADTFMLMSKSWDKLFWNSIKLFGFVIVFYLLINSYFGWQFIESIYINFNYNAETLQILEMVILTLITTALFSVYFFFQVITSIFSFYSFKETVFAENLNKRIDLFGERSVLFGFEKEK